MQNEEQQGEERATDKVEPYTGFSPRTDLAIEAHDSIAGGRSVKGVDVETEHIGDDLSVSRVHVRTKEGGKAIGKPKGKYITLEANGLRHREPDLYNLVSEQFAKEFLALFPFTEDTTVLVVGLGNAHVTPDALGPSVVERMFVTRHLFRYMPDVIGDGFRTVSAVSPGVLGVTGIETSEIVRGIVDHIKPDLIVAVDALAARSLSRVNATIQMTDSGIQPGAGVGNKRKALDRETLGVPVIAIGVPTVVDAATIANDCIELVLTELGKSVPGNGANSIFDQFTGEEKWQMIRELLEPGGNNLIVTPKEVDEFVGDIAQVVARGLNLALHPDMTSDDVDMLMH